MKTPRARRAIVLPCALVAIALAACHATAKAPSFEKHVLDSSYRAEGVAVFDVNHDGKADIVTDQFWYAGPSFAPNEIRTPETYDPATGFADGFAVYSQDIDGDGWDDIIVAPHPGNVMLWYRNPEGQAGRWTPSVIAPAGVAGLETPIVADIFGTGTPVLIMTDSVKGVLAWFTPPSDPTQPWEEHPISGPGYPGAPVYTHGIGAGDVDGDGRLDVLTGYGWFQQTSDASTWIEHSFTFGPNPLACSRMFVTDLNLDGLGDVLCSRPHDYGLHWLEQQRGDAGAAPTFIDHVIDDSISEMHALRYDDLDGDGVPEIISGKRFWARGPEGDPGASDPASLVYYRVEGAGHGPSFAKHVIDSDSGVGTQFAVADVDADGKPDIVVSSKKGLAYFLQH